MLILPPWPTFVGQPKKKRAEVTPMLTWRLACKPPSVGNQIKLWLSQLEVRKPVFIMESILTAYNSYSFHTKLSVNSVIWWLTANIAAAPTSYHCDSWVASELSYNAAAAASQSRLLSVGVLKQFKKDKCTLGWLLT